LGVKRGIGLNSDSSPWGSVYWDHCIGAGCGTCSRSKKTAPELGKKYIWFSKIMKRVHRQNLLVHTWKCFNK
jgi:hypothetical protein